jgi:AcrR family transcriptional regulator
MGIYERRARERDRRRREILDSAWQIAEELGWPGFSVERVAERAELGRATVYGYFDSLESLVGAMADDALEILSSKLSSTDGLAEALDAPLRFSQAHPAAFALLFQEIVDPRPALSKNNLGQPRQEAAEMLATLRRLASRGKTLPADVAAADAFLAGIAMAGVVVPELRNQTPLRRRWQDFCLNLGGKLPAGAGSGLASPPSEPDAAESAPKKR